MKKLTFLLAAVCCTVSLLASNVITYTANDKLPEVTKMSEYGLHINAFDVSVLSHTFTDGVGTITFSGNVSVIGSNAFYECDKLTSITIPNTTHDIKSKAFSGCSKLTSIIIPDSVFSIGEYAFYECSDLASVTIGNAVYGIGKYAFGLCSGLTYVIIPNSVTRIGEYAFDNCVRLASVTIGNSVTEIGTAAFCRCQKLTSVTILGNSLTLIGGNAFAGCTGLTSLTIPSSVTLIGSSAFGGVRNIIYSGTALGSPWGAICVNGHVDGYLVYRDSAKTTLCSCSTAATGEIVIPNSTTTIEANVFSYCSNLTSITIPSSVTTIGADAFYGCTRLEKTNYLGTISQWCSIGFVDAVSNPMYHSKNLYLNNVEVKGDLVIQSDVTTINPFVFYLCTGLTSVTIPNSVTTIGFSAFYQCSNMTSVTIGNSVTTIEEFAFASCFGLRKIEINTPQPPVTTIEAFHLTSKSITIVIPCGTLNAYQSAPIWKDFTGYVENLYEIMVHSANWQQGSARVVQPNSCESDMAVIIATPRPGCTFKQWSDGNTDNPRSILVDKDTILTAYFEGTPTPTTITYTASTKLPEAIAPSDAGLHTNAFDANIVSHTFNNGEGVITFDGVVYSMWADAFFYTTGMSSITIPNTVMEIGDNAFFCSGLTYIVIPNSVASVGVGAFSACSQLKSVSIGNGVTKIGLYAFNGCNAVQEIRSYAVVPPVAETFSFNDVPKSAKIIVPCGTISAYKAAPNWCDFTNYEEGSAYCVTVRPFTPQQGSAEVIQPTTCENDMATIEATPRAGYVFDQWSDGNTDNPRSILVNQDIELMAYFKSVTGTSSDEMSIQTKNIKFIRDGQLYILCDGKIYNVLGNTISLL